MPIGEFIGDVLLRGFLGFLEVVLYTLAYYTGAITFWTVTLGTIRLAPLSSIDQTNRGRNRWTDWSIWLHRDRQGRLLKAEVVILTGLLLWLGVGAGLYFTFRGDQNEREQTKESLELGTPRATAR